MSRRGEITVECDTPDCHAEWSLTAHQMRARSVRDWLDFEGWEMTGEGKDRCPDCSMELRHAGDTKA
jgi:hypothetical protein